MKYSRLIAFFSAVLGMTAIGMGEPAESPGHGISGENIKAVYRNGQIQICTRKGLPIFGLEAVYLFHSPVLATPAEAQNLSDHSLRVCYRVQNDPSGQIKVECICQVTGDRIRMDYEVSLPPEWQKKVIGISQEFKPYRDTVIGGVYKNGIWTRVPNGVPFEKRGVYMKSINHPAIRFYMPVTGNHYYSQGRRCAMAFRERNGNRWRDHLEISGFRGLNDFEAAARLDGEPFALQLTSPRRFNIFASGTPQFTLVATSNEPRARKNVKLTVKAYDYDGNFKLNETRDIDFAPDQRQTFTYSLPAEKRNIFFIEAAVAAAGKECFTRTTLAILPPHQYADPEHSRLGLSGNFQIYDDPQLTGLLKRIGVRYNRNGDNAKTAPLGIISFFHANVKPSPYDPPKDHARIVEMVDSLEKNHAPWFEFCNEWSGDGNARYDLQKKRLFADYYRQWLQALRQEISRRRLPVKIMSVAIGGAGADTAFVEFLHNNGSWDMLDGIAFHPGRGNNVPDLTGSGWRYLGSIRNMAAKLREYGGKPLFLTEVYAPTQPNNSWCDSLRRAGENVLLTMMLGYAENARVIFMFKWNEGISWDVNGVNEKNREWSFGIMNRDGSPKPSMMGYAAAAEALDGATFQRYLEIPGTKVKGMEFLTPRGKMAVLYDRNEGYWARINGKSAPHLEPWLDHWNGHRNYSFAGSTETVKVIDSIGREKIVPTQNGKVTLTLSGTPVIVYGLNIPPLPPAQ